MDTGVSPPPLPCWLLAAGLSWAAFGTPVAPAHGRPATPQDAASAQLEEMERRAQRLYAEGQLDRAATLYSQIASRVRSAPERARLLINAAWLQHLLGRSQPAAEMLRQALSAAPDYPFESGLYDQSFVDLYLGARQSAAEDRGRRAEELIRRGVEGMAAGDYQGSRALLEQALKIQPNHPSTLFNLALLDLEHGHQDEAITGFEKLLALAAAGQIQLSPELEAETRMSLGFLFYSKAFYADAEQMLAEAVRLDPTRATAWNNLGLCRRGLGDNRGATEAFLQARQLDPDDSDVIKNLALSFMDEEMWQAANELLQEGISRHPEDPGLWLNLALLQRRAGDAAGAVESLRRVLTLDPEDQLRMAQRASFYLALIYYRQQDYVRAVEAARRTLTWNPEDVDGWIYLGLAQQGLGDLQQARLSLERARSLDPSRAEVFNNLGSVYFELGERDLAEEAFERALAIRPDLVAASENLEAVRAQAAASPVAENAEIVAEPAPAPPPPKARSAKTRRREPVPAQESRPLGARFSVEQRTVFGMKGILVEEVIEGSLAAEAGLRAGDLILRVNGGPVGSARELEQKLQGSATATVTLDLTRNEKPQRIVWRVR